MTCIFINKKFVSHSGLELFDKIDCDSLTTRDWNAIAAWISRRIKFGKVVGIPRGGLKLAKALSKYATKGPVLIVDDVLTTGASMEKERVKHKKAIGFVLFSRTNQIPKWITARFVEFTPETRGIGIGWQEPEGKRHVGKR